MTRPNQFTDPTYDHDKQLKRCGFCRQWKPFSDFTKLGGKYPEWRLKSYCRSCRAERTKVRKYGLEYGDWQRLLDSQQGRCAICRRSGKTKRLSIDHNHKTGEIRGLLCISCNRAIGYLDNKIWLRAAIKYLKKN